MNKQFGISIGKITADEEIPSSAGGAGNVQLPEVQVRKLQNSISNFS